MSSLSNGKYEVKLGDCLLRIAIAHRCSVEDILEQNKDLDPLAIAQGTIIIVPETRRNTNTNKSGQWVFDMGLTSGGNAVCVRPDSSVEAISNTCITEIIQAHEDCDRNWIRTRETLVFTRAMMSAFKTDILTVKAFILKADGEFSVAEALLKHAYYRRCGLI